MAMNETEEAQIDLTGQDAQAAAWRRQQSVWKTVRVPDAASPKGYRWTRQRVSGMPPPPASEEPLRVFPDDCA